MITLYESTETNFNHNGIGVLNECIRAETSREINGVWQLQLEYPLFDSKGLALELQDYRIIKVPTPSGDQLFRIQKPEKGLTSVSIDAIHIVFDLADNFVIDTDIVGKNRLQAVQQILQNTMNPHRFTVTGDNTGITSLTRITRKNPIAAIFSSDEGSVMSIWGGEVDFDNFNLIVKDQIGIDSGYLISYGKNLTDIKEIFDTSSVATRIIPEGSDGLLLPEYYIDSPLIGAYHQPIVRNMKFDQIKIDDYSTAEEAYQALRSVVNKLFTESHVDQPFFNYEIEFVHLGDTEEYKQFKSLTRLNLGDRLKIRDLKRNIDLYGRLIAYTYDCITKKYLKVQLGTVKKDINMVINQTVAAVNFVKQKIELGITSLDEKLSSKIQITEEGILQEVQNTKDGLEASISTTALQIRQEMSSSNQGLQSSITQTAGEIRQDLTDTTNNLQTQITTQAGLISQKVEDSTFQSYKTQAASEISQKIVKGSVISEINQSLETIKIQADKLNLNGYATFSSLSTPGQTIINGANIQTQTISFMDLNSKPFIPITAADVGARPNTWTPTAEEVGAKPATYIPNWAEIFNKPFIPSTATDVGARPNTWMPTAIEVGAKPSTYIPDWNEVSSKPFIPKTAADVGARPNDWFPDWAAVLNKPNMVSPTYIGPTGLYTGTVLANQIAAGTVVAGSIDATNASINGGSILFKIAGVTRGQMNGSGNMIVRSLSSKKDSDDPNGNYSGGMDCYDLSVEHNANLNAANCMSLTVNGVPVLTTGMSVIARFG